MRPPPSLLGIEQVRCMMNYVDFFRSEKLFIPVKFLHLHSGQRSSSSSRLWPGLESKIFQAR